MSSETSPGLNPAVEETRNTRPSTRHIDLQASEGSAVGRTNWRMTSALWFRDGDMRAESVALGSLRLNSKEPRAVERTWGGRGLWQLASLLNSLLVQAAGSFSHSILPSSLCCFFFFR